MLEPGQYIHCKTAVITERSVISEDLLKEKVASVVSSLQFKGIKPFDRVVLYVSEDTYLMAVLWALLKKEITCIPIDSRCKDVDLHAFATDCNARWIISEKRYEGMNQFFETLIFQEIQVPENLSEGQKEFIPYIFYNNGLASTISDKELLSFFEVLDKELLPERNDVLLISRNISFSKRVTEIIWASSRGIPVILRSPEHNRPAEHMEFGLFHFGSYAGTPGVGKYDLLFDTVRFADEHGFGSVWTPERHFNEFGGLFPNPSVLSAALAAITSHVQIRSGSLVAPLHHAVRIAEDWSLVDNLSNGRVAISFASGWQCDDFVFYPENYPVRHESMMERIDEVRRLWRGETISCSNGLGKMIDVAIFPKPVQKELPVWITVSGRTETFTDAGRIGANILTHLLWQDTDELIEKIAAYRKSLKDNGFDPGSRKVTVMVHTFLGLSNEIVKEKVKDPLKSYIRHSTQLIQSMVKSNITSTDAKDIAGRYGGLDAHIPEHLMDELTEMAFQRFFEHAGLLGTIEKASRLILRLKEYDVDEIAALIDFGLSRDDIMDGLEHLTRLKEIFTKDESAGYTATLAHCCAGMLESIKATCQPQAMPEMTGIEGIFRIHRPAFLQDNISSLFTSSVTNDF